MTVVAVIEARIAVSAASRTRAVQSAAEKPSVRGPKEARSIPSSNGTPFAAARRMSPRASASGGGA